jgi:hypothetical protein
MYLIGECMLHLLMPYCIKVWRSHGVLPTEIEEILQMTKQGFDGASGMEMHAAKQMFDRDLRRIHRFLFPLITSFAGLYYHFALPDRERHIIVQINS